MTIQVKVKPGSKVDQWFYDAAGVLTIKIKAPAQDGKANAYLVEFLAKQFTIPKAGVTIVSGFTSPFKRIEVEADSAAIESILTSIRG